MFVSLRQVLALSTRKFSPTYKPLKVCCFQTDSKIYQYDK